MGTSSRSTTSEKKRARRELAALARVGIDVCNILASCSEENNDTPRHYLARLDRWTVGEATGAALAWIADSRAAVAAGCDATTIEERVVRCFAMAVQCVEGGELESAEQRVRTMLEERRGAATDDAIE
jgi:hypothetical protein